MDELSGQYLSFKLQQEDFALDIAHVREVLDLTRLTRVPKAPDYVRGVINLRGAVVPVVDLNLKFGHGLTTETVHTRIIIGEVTVSGELTTLGVIADAVQEVMELDEREIEPSPRIGTSLDTGFLKGMGRREDDFVMILDIDKVFATDGLTLDGLGLPQVEDCA
ncbi:MAG: Chemotaxis protein CheW [Deltaproteobacteria bacterium ADurb.Bin510]|nr:MAG: Chemotaxis protein CheW [Deltaproteobacteria bacterium ADurb.Bin510]